MVCRLRTWGKVGWVIVVERGTAIQTRQEQRKALLPQKKKES